MASLVRLACTRGLWHLVLSLRNTLRATAHRMLGLSLRCGFQSYTDDEAVGVRIHMRTFASSLFVRGLFRKSRLLKNVASWVATDMVEGESGEGVGERGGDGVSSGGEGKGRL